MGDRRREGITDFARRPNLDSRDAQDRGGRSHPRMNWKQASHIPALKFTTLKAAQGRKGLFQTKEQSKASRRRTEEHCPGRPADFVEMIIAIVVLKLKVMWA